MLAIGYIRVSTEDQAKEGISLAAQKKKIELYCELKNFTLLEIIADEGISAKDLKRPGVKKLIEKVENREIDVIIVYKLDRIFRSTVDALETSQNFKKKDVALHSIQENLDTDSAIGRFFFTLLSALGQMERELIGERTKMALTHLKENNKVYGTIPYGKKRVEYAWTKGKNGERKKVGGRLTDDVIELHNICKIGDLFATYGMYSIVADKMNDRGSKTRSGGKWYPQQIKNIIKGG